MIKWLEKQVEWIKSFLSESPNGTGVQKGSSKRVAAIGVTVTFIYTYTKIAIANNAMPDIPEGWRWVLFIVLGVTGTADVIKQKFGNGKSKDKI